MTTTITRPRETEVTVIDVETVAEHLGRYPTVEDLDRMAQAGAFLTGEHALLYELSSTNESERTFKNYKQELICLHE